jgi:hypothetical protein
MKYLPNLKHVLGTGPRLIVPIIQAGCQQPSSRFTKDEFSVFLAKDFILQNNTIRILAGVFEATVFEFYIGLLNRIFWLIPISKLATTIRIETLLTALSFRIPNLFPYSYTYTHLVKWFLLGVQRLI